LSEGAEVVFADLLGGSLLDLQESFLKRLSGLVGTTCKRGHSLLNHQFLLCLDGHLYLGLGDGLGCNSGWHKCRGVLVENELTRFGVAEDIVRLSGRSWNEWFRLLVKFKFRRRQVQSRLCHHWLRENIHGLCGRLRRELIGCRLRLRLGLVRLIAPNWFLLEPIVVEVIAVLHLHWLRHWVVRHWVVELLLLGGWLVL